MINQESANVIITLYGIGVTLLTLYTIGQFHLLYYYLTPNSTKRFRNPDIIEYDPAQWPKVTVQLPMFNELYVAEKVIDACAKLDYPADKLQIQVVDDSDDETVEIVETRAAFWQSKGVNVEVFHRDNRRGFKAGALKDATPHATGDFIAIFDADFQPHSDFLKKMIPYFKDDSVGVVQGRWGHLNRTFSWLTYSQTIFLDMFFIIEQKARALGGFFLRFNGSGGIWRKSCIDDAGGWSDDTLCEDLDLCYRAQLKNWKIIYDESVIAPAEVPVSMLDFKAQQYRWTKGKIQVIKKLMGSVIGSKLPMVEKAHALFDLVNVFAVLGILILAIFSIPVVYLIASQPEYTKPLAIFSFGLINVVLVPLFVWYVIRTYETSKRQTLLKTIIGLPIFSVIITGIPLFQFVSMVDGFLGRKSYFHRTAKYDIEKAGNSWKDKVYSPKEVPFLTYFEGLLAIYFGFGIYLDFHLGIYAFLPFHIILTLSYFTVFYLSFKKL